MKVRFLIALFVIFLAILPISAQNNASGNSEEGFYYVSVPIEKIYSYRLGYVVVYRKGQTQMARAYIPHEWFSGAATTGDIVLLSSGTRWPTMTVFYQNGEFSHVRLYLRQERNHETWGNVNQGLNIDDRFQNVQDIKLEF